MCFDIAVFLFFSFFLFLENEYAQIGENYSFPAKQSNI